MSDHIDPGFAPGRSRERRRYGTALVILIAIFALALSVAIAATAVSIGLVWAAEPTALAISQDRFSPRPHHLWKIKKAPSAISAKPMA